MKKNDENVDFEEIIKDIIYNAKDITDLNEIEQDIKDCDYNLQALVYDKLIFHSVKRYIIKDTNLARAAPCKSKEYEDFEKQLKNDDELKKRISDAINNCRKYLDEFQDFYQFVENIISIDYNYIQNDKKGRTTSTLLKLEKGILEIDEGVSFRDNVKQFINLLKDYLHKTKYSTYYHGRNKREHYNIAKELQKMCLKYGHRCIDLKKFYLRLRSTIIEQRSFMLSYLSKQYHKKYFKKACICLFVAFIWFVITSLSMNIGHWSIDIIEVLDINFEPILEVNDEWLKYIIWITIKTPSIILAWIGLSYLRAADRHDQDAKELSNLYQYKSMITDPVTQDALMVALAPNYFGTKRNKRSDNNFMEKLLLKMIPTPNINAGGGSNNGNNGGQNGGQTP